MSSFGPIEEIIYDGFMSIVGDPAYMGLMLLGFFGGAVFMAQARYDLIVGVLTCAVLLSLVFIPALGILLAFALGTILYFALMKVAKK